MLKKDFFGLIFIIGFLLSTSQVFAQGQFSGNVVLDAYMYQNDASIGAIQPSEKMLSAAYSNLKYSSNNFEFGMRFESYLNAPLGIDSRLSGQGIPYKYAKYRNDEMEITVGSFYETFGNGLILKAYEEKTLGYDNAFEGLNFRYSPFEFLHFKSVLAKQRNFFDIGNGIVRGLDTELNILGALKPESASNLDLGFSFVSKFQPDTDPIYILPENVSAMSGRILYSGEAFQFQTEYAHKINDPSADNGFVYMNGNALSVQTSYAKQGFSVNFTARRLQNMAFRSDRAATLNQLYINYLPSLTAVQTYSFGAMYPYATQPLAEIAFVGEIMYKFQKETTVGGKYGAFLSLTYEQSNNLKRENKAVAEEGFSAEFLAPGDLYYQNFALDFRKKWSKNYKNRIMYFYQTYDKDVIQGLAGYGKIYANVFVYDAIHKLKPRHNLRTEIQVLVSKQDKGNWYSGLLEYTVAPHYFLAAGLQSNIDQVHNENQHFYSLSGGYSKNAYTFRLSYGKQREGILCVGGVCRQVPAFSGLQFQFSTTF